MNTETKIRRTKRNDTLRRAKRCGRRVYNYAEYFAAHRDAFGYADGRSVGLDGRVQPSLNSDYS